mmetsp:Transcript_103264/g.301231  ORF Transcript_103264/g.301231 Transcript_103264/m.301231 type:complete len:630 (+) Transcript_103264:60-1949(+)
MVGEQAHCNYERFAVLPENGEPLNGEALHNTVPMDCWCVSRSDLLRLRADLKSAIRAGMIHPTDLDNFDPDDDVFGPCVHTVVAQFIKPVTRLAGDVSWALMLHPEGLRCDLFVTHAWQEGFFEFIDKVVANWPPAAKGAYCCMLSNPQSLDISGMISTPLTSPFALALKSASFMLVVPNRRYSIYSRIWCAYEAYLAYIWGKCIFTALLPPPGFWPSMLRMAVLCIVSFALVLTLSLLDLLYMDVGAATTTHNVGGLIYFGSILVVLLGSCNDAVHCVCCAIAAALGGALFGRHLGAVLAHDTAWLNGAQLGTHGLAPWCGVLSMFAAAGLGVVTNRDRLAFVQQRAESDELCNGFTGRVIDALSSVPEDKEKIMSEISSNESPEIVDAAIDVLLCSGMSTPDLRLLHSYGVNIARAGAPQFSIYAIFAVVLAAFLEMIVGCRVDIAAMVIWLAELFAFGYSLASSARDSHVFQTRAFTKVLMLEVPLMLLVDNVASAILGENVGAGTCLASQHSSKMGHVYLEIEVWVILLLRAACLAVTIAGPSRTLYVPRLGPCIVRFILGKASRPELDQDGGAYPSPARKYHCVAGCCSCHGIAQEELPLTRAGLLHRGQPNEDAHVLKEIIAI